MGCEQMRLRCADAALWAAGNQPFSFRASHYPQEMLTAAAHNFELKNATRWSCVWTTRTVASAPTAAARCWPMNMP